MTIQPLPKYINPKRLCEEKTALIGELPVSRFERLKEILADDEGKVVVDLLFDKDEQRLSYIKGRLQVDWHLICQRCSRKLPQMAEFMVSLSPVFSEEAANRLPATYEPLMMEDEKILLLTLIEDELLLGMPIVPKHETSECEQILQAFNDKEDGGVS